VLTTLPRKWLDPAKPSRGQPRMRKGSVFVLEEEDTARPSKRRRRVTRSAMSQHALNRETSVPLRLSGVGRRAFVDASGEKAASRERGEKKTERRGAWTEKATAKTTTQAGNPPPSCARNAITLKGTPGIACEGRRSLCEKEFHRKRRSRPRHSEGLVVLKGAERNLLRKEGVVPFMKLESPASREEADGSVERPIRRGAS